MSRSVPQIAPHRACHVVIKQDVGVAAPYVVGAFTNKSKAIAACRGAGTFTIISCRQNRVYPQGTLLDVDVIDNMLLTAHKAL